MTTPNIAFTAKIAATGIIVVTDTSTGLPAGIKSGMVNYGDGNKGGIPVGKNASYRYAKQGAYVVTLTFRDSDGTAYTASGPVAFITALPASFASLPNTAAAPDAAATPTSPPPPPASVNAYAQALAAMTLPVTSAWSGTRPDYTAQSTITLADGTVLTCDTSKQAPDYVPYTGTWVYPYLRNDGTRHPDLSLWCYNDRVRAGNVWVDASANYAGHIALSINGSQVVDADTTFNAGCFTAANRQGLPQVAPQRNWDPKMLPNYGKLPGGYDSWASKLAAADNSLDGRSITTPGEGMSNAGEQVSIGLVPGYHVPWIVDGGDDNWRVSQAIEDHTGCWPIHQYSRITGLPCLPAVPHCQDVCYNNFIPGIGSPLPAGHVNPVKIKTASPHVPNVAHMPGFGIVPYLTSGASGDLEELLAWASYCLADLNPVGRGWTKCLTSGSQRAVAWQLRSVGYAAALCPDDHPLKPYLVQVMLDNCDKWTAAHIGGPNANPFGIFGAASTFSYRRYGNENCAFAQFQQNYTIVTLHQLVQIEAPGNWVPLRDFCNQYTVGAMGDGGPDGKTGMYWTLATAGHVPARIFANYPKPQALTAEYVADWTALRNNLLNYGFDTAGDTQVDDPDAPHPFANQQDLSLAQVDVGFGPGKPYYSGNIESPTDYWAYSQCTYAIAADCGHPAPWNIYDANVRPLKNFASQGGWNIVPRVR